MAARADAAIVEDPLLLPGDPGYERLPTRDKVRNVALSHIAERGIEGTTVRGVARAAGVSPSLLQHHFVTKEGLRTACDQYVVTQLRRNAQSAGVPGRIADPDVLALLYRTAPPVVQYLAKALTDGSPAAAELFDHVVAVVEQLMTDSGCRELSADAHRAAAVYACMKLGVFVLHQHLTRTLGTDVLTPGNLNQVRAIMLGVFSGGLGQSTLVEDARQGIAGFDEAAMIAE